MFPDSLTFCVDAVYATEACSGVPSILDDCYYRAIFCWLLNFPLFRGDGPAPWSKNLCIWIFTLKTDPFSLMVCTPKDWASFHPCTAEGWNYSIPSADEEQTKWRERKSIYACTLLGLHGWVCVCVCAQSTCRESRNLLEISVIIINIYIDISYSSSSLDLALSFFPCFVIKLCLVLV